MRRLVWVAAIGCGMLWGPSCGVVGGGAAPPGQTTLVVRVTDGPSGPLLPARLVLYDEEGEPLRIGTLDVSQGRDQDRGYCELADGVVGTWDGIALAFGVGEMPVGEPVCDEQPAIPYGRYRLKAMRGGEHEMFETTVDLRPGRGVVIVEAPLERVFSPDGALAADLHVHADGSPDSLLPRRIRVITEAAAGIQVIGSTDHNVNGDFATEIAELGLAAFVASLPGSEVSADVLHFNVFPVVVDPTKPGNGSLGTYEEVRARSVASLFQAAHALPGRPLVAIAHARLGWAAYFDSVGWDGESWPPPMPLGFDALEVLNGLVSFNLPDDRRLDRIVGDFYTLARHGVLVTPLGASDTHHLNGVLAGVPRTYVYVNDTRTEPFDAEGFADALRARRTLATSGPWLEVSVNGSGAGETAEIPAPGEAPVEIRLRQASYVKATRVRILVGGQVVRTLDVPPGARAFDWAGTVSVAGDTWIGVDAGGDEPLPLELTGDWVRSRGQIGVLPFALVSPVRVDVGGDGWTFGEPAKPVPEVDVPPRAGAPSAPPDCFPPP